MSIYDYEHPADREKRLAADTQRAEAKRAAFVAVVTALGSIEGHDAVAILKAAAVFLRLESTEVAP
jgi:hypothetical protein